jgi:hypothetical protein
MDGLEKFNNIAQYGTTRSTIPVTWTDDDLNFEWLETVQTLEVPVNDPWDSFTTDMKYELQELHSGWKVPDASTWHLMAHKPELNDNLKPILNHFSYKNLSYNFIKITPGHMLVWHYDTYATFVHRNDLTFADADKIKRSAILMNDRDRGQIIEVGNNIIAHWKAGSVLTWESFAWHGAANFGPTDMIVMQISYLDE